METKLSSISFELTKTCNLRCIHCYLNKERKNISIKTIIKVLNTLNGKLCGDIILTGGEPLLHPEFKIIYEYVRNMGNVVNIFTNGIYIEKQIMMTGIHYPHCIEVSVYGFSENIYASVTKKRKVFGIIKNNIEKMVEQNYNFILKYILI